MATIFARSTGQLIEDRLQIRKQASIPLLLSYNKRCISIIHLEKIDYYARVNVYPDIAIPNLASQIATEFSLHLDALKRPLQKILALGFSGR